MINLTVINYQNGENRRLYLDLTSVSTHMLQPFYAECCDYIGDDFVQLQCVTDVKEFVRRFAVLVYRAPTRGRGAGRECPGAALFGGRHVW